MDDPATDKTATPPPWFEWAISKMPKSRIVDVDGCPIHYLMWGSPDAGSDGLLFIHGGGAHAHWWSFIAPFFAENRPVAAIDLSGNALLVLPFCVLLFLVSIDYVRLSWSVLEGSRETSGIQAVFLLKSIILVFAVQLALQAVSGMIKAAYRLRDREARVS